MWFLAGVWLSGQSSDRTGERKWHCVAGQVFTGLFLAASVIPGQSWGWTITWLCLVGFFAYFFVYILTGISFLRERIGGTLEAYKKRAWKSAIEHLQHQHAIVPVVLHLIQKTCQAWTAGATCRA